MSAGSKRSNDNRPLARGNHIEVEMISSSGSSNSDLSGSGSDQNFGGEKRRERGSERQNHPHHHHHYDRKDKATGDEMEAGAARVVGGDKDEDDKKRRKRWSEDGYKRLKKRKKYYKKRYVEVDGKLVEIPDDGRLDFRKAEKVRNSERPLDADGNEFSIFACIRKHEVQKKLGRGSSAYLFFVQDMALFCLIIAVLNCWWCYFYYTSSDTSYWATGDWIISNNTKYSDVNKLVNGSFSVFWRLSITHWGFDRSIKNFDDSGIALWIILGLSRIVIAIAYIVFFRIFKIWMKKKLTNARKKQLKTSDYSVFITGLPPETKGTTLGLFFQDQFGPVKHVAIALNTDKIEKNKKTRKALERSIRYYDIRVRKFGEAYNTLSWFWKLRYHWCNWRLGNCKTQLEAARHEYTLLTSDAYEYVCCGSAFITFEYEESKFKCLAAFNPPKLALHKQTPLFLGNKIKVEVATEPSNVNWHNLEQNRASLFARRIVAIIICTVIVIAAFAAFTALLVGKFGFGEFFRALYSTTKVGDNIDQGLRDLLKGSGSTAQYSSFTYTVSNLLVVSLPFAVISFILNHLLTWVLQQLSDFERHRFISDANRSIMVKVALSEIGCGVVTILIGNLILGHMFNVKLFYDTYSLIFFSLVGMIAFNLGYELLKRPFYALRRKIMVKFAMTQEELYEAMVCPDMNMALRYAFQLKNILAGVIYSTIWPLASAIIGFSLIISYFIEKHNILRVYRKPLQSRDRLYIPATQIISVGFALWFIVDLVFQPLKLYSDSSKNSKDVNVVGGVIYFVCWVVSVIMFVLFTIASNFAPGSAFIRSLFWSPFRNWRHQLTTSGIDFDSAQLVPYRAPVDQNAIKMKASKKLMKYKEKLAKKKEKEARKALK